MAGPRIRRKATADSVEISSAVELDVGQTPTYSKNTSGIGEDSVRNTRAAKTPDFVAQRIADKHIGTVRGNRRQNPRIISETRIKRPITIENVHGVVVRGVLTDHENIRRGRHEMRASQATGSGTLGLSSDRDQAVARREHAAHEISGIRARSLVHQSQGVALLMHQHGQ